MPDAPTARGNPPSIIADFPTALGVDGLVLCGIATSGVVLSTLRAAADLDFRCTVLADCCADADEEVHRVLTTKVFPRQAQVLTAGDWVAGPRGAGR